jgi:cob(I)alamin adenosyltransferase
MSQGPKSFQSHTAHMARVQKARRKIQATKTIERGLLIVHTGRGKGKSSSAFGMAIRSLGWGKKVAIVQYVKGKWQTGEKKFFGAHPDLLTFEAMGEGFTWDTQDRERDIAAARTAWERSKELIMDPA